MKIGDTPFFSDDGATGLSGLIFLFTKDWKRDYIVRMKREFKKCNMCLTSWFEVEEFLSDPEIRFIGMQIDPEYYKEFCLYYFQHDRSNCKTSLTLDVEKFKKLTDEPIPSEIMALQEACPEYCADLTQTLICNNPCRNAPYKRLAKIIANYPKANRN